MEALLWRRYSVPPRRLEVQLAGGAGDPWDCQDSLQGLSVSTGGQSRGQRIRWATRRAATGG